MSLNRRKLILIAVALAAVVGVVLVSWLTSRSDTPAPQVVSQTPSAAPSADLIALDRALLEQLSSDLAVRFRTFDKLDAAYVSGLEPYVTTQFLDDYRSTFRYSDRVSFLQPVRSRAVKTELTGQSTTTATAVVRLDSVELATNRPYSQEITISWQKFGDRWRAVDIETRSIEAGGTDG